MNIPKPFNVYRPGFAKIYFVHLLYVVFVMSILVPFLLRVFFAHHPSPFGQRGLTLDPPEVVENVAEHVGILLPGIARL